jgi:hypothetical protein
MPGARKVPAILKAPFDYLLALVICLGPVFGSIVVEPPLTRWIVFGVGVGMFLSVLIAAARPVDA